MSTTTRTIHDTHNGINIQYDITTPIPRLPLNLDATLRRALFTLAALMTTGAIIWGTVAIGSMLTLLAPPWAAYLVAGVFDAGWAGCLIAEWLLRYDSKRSELPRQAGFAMLTVSMAAITVHGIIAGAWAIGIVGALVSAAAKGVWAIGMHTIRIQLDPRHEAYLRALQQQSGTELALALGERDRLLTENRTVSLKLALEARRPNIPTIVQDTHPQPDTADISEATKPAALPEQIANSHDHAREQIASTAEQIANKPQTSENTDRDLPSISDLAREQIAITEDNKVAVASIMAARPDANKESVAAAVRRARKTANGTYL
jgi:hypothetical protein